MFHHRSGAFPIAASRYHVTDEAIACEVAIGAATHRVVLIGADAARFTRAVIDAD